MFLATLHAHKLFSLIYDSYTLRGQILASSYPRLVFIKLFTDKMTANEDTNRLYEMTCENSHKFVNIMEKVVRYWFKEFSSEKSTATFTKTKKMSNNPKKSSTARKHIKLQSESV